MGRLTLVRHGQAAFLTEDYDRLSPLGKRQLRYLGDYWVGNNVRVDRFATGTLKRHRQSAEALVEAFRAAKKPLPEIIEIPGLDEFPWDAMIEHASQTLTAAIPELRALHGAFLGASVPRDKHRTFQRFMESVTMLWAQDAFQTEAVESFAAFDARVSLALDALMDGVTTGTHVVAVTSGGPAAIAVRRALSLPPEKTLELIWTLRNGALVEFFFKPDRFSLSMFNATPHLGTPDLWTYR
jgi:broad specificity phosphatase PhoE